MTPLPGHRRRLDGRTGSQAGRGPRPHRQRHLQPAAKNMLLQIDATLLYGQGHQRSPPDRQDARQPVQHLQVQGPAAHAHRLARLAVADRRPPTRRRPTSCTTCSSTRAASTASPPPPPSSPSWRPRPGRRACSDRRQGPGRPAGPRSPPGWRRSSAIRSTIPSPRSCTTPPSRPSGSTGSTWPSRWRPVRCPRPWPGYGRWGWTGCRSPCPTRRRWRPDGPAEPDRRPGSARSTPWCAGVTELVGESTDGDGFVAALRDDEGWDPAGRRCVVLGAGGRPGP